MKQFQQEEFQKKLEAFQKRVAEESVLGRASDAANSVVYLDEKKTCFEAQDHCHAVHGTDLVSVPSDAFNTSLGKAIGTMASNSKSPVWIGLRRPSRYFVWSDKPALFF